MRSLSSPNEPTHDFRLYVPFSKEWTAKIKTNWDKDYCYAKNPGEEYFHLLMNGEIFVQNGDEKYCLTCAYRRGVLTSERLYWQKGAFPAADGSSAPQSLSQEDSGERDL